MGGSVGFGGLTWAYVGFGGKRAWGVAVAEIVIRSTEVVVIGAGQAGLSSAYFLSRFGFEPVVLDAGEGPGGAWRNRSPSLTMDKVHGVFDLPGVPRRPDADGLRPAAEAVPAYYADYEREAGLHVLRPVRVTAVRSMPPDSESPDRDRSGTSGDRSEAGGDQSGTDGGRSVTDGARSGTDGARSGADGSRSGTGGGRSGTGGGRSGTGGAQMETDGERAGIGGGRLVIETDAGEWAARAVVNATGTWSRPYWPYYPGAATFAGRQLHYASYRGPAEFAGRRVVVVGGGASAMHVLSEIAGVAAATAWVTRRPPVFREDDFGEEARRDAVAMVEERVRAGLPPQSVVSVTGLTYSVVVREALEKGALERLPMFDRIVEGGVTWDGGTYLPADTIIWATGFRSALDHLAPLHLRTPGGGIRVDGTQAIDEPRLQLVGYGPSASTIGANRAGRTAARNVRAYLKAHANPRPAPTPSADLLSA